MESKEESEKRIKVININRNENENTNENGNTSNTNKEPKRWHSTGEATGEAVKKSRRRGFKKKVAALIAAGTILGCVGGYYVIQNINEVEIEATSSEDALSEETEDMLEKYTEIFEEVDNGTYDYSDMSADKLQEMVDEVESLYFSVIKEKMSSLTEIDKSDFTLRYYDNDDSGTIVTRVIAYEGEYNEESWYNDGRIIHFGKQSNTISDDISDAIYEIAVFDNIRSKIEEEIKNGEISFVEILKELEESYYYFDSKIVTSDFIMDENGNITLDEIEQEQTQSQQIARNDVQYSGTNVQTASKDERNNEEEER